MVSSYLAWKPPVGNVKQAGLVDLGVDLGVPCSAGQTGDKGKSKQVVFSGAKNRLPGGCQFRNVPPDHFRWPLLGHRSPESPPFMVYFLATPYLNHTLTGILSHPCITSLLYHTILKKGLV